MNPGPPPLVNQPDPPTYRVLSGIKLGSGGMAVPSHGVGLGSHTGVYGSRDFGERHGEINWRQYDRMSHAGGGHGHTDEFIPGHSIVDPEEVLIQSDHDDSGGGRCGITCDSHEYFCKKACDCVEKELRCDGNIDCATGEDEEECHGNNEETINAMKLECESTGLRIMCPRTYTCISKEWLCDGDDDCGDYSDETHCGEASLNFSIFKRMIMSYGLAID